MKTIDDLLTRPVLAAEVAERLTMDIVTLKLPPGSRLIEDDVGRRFGISRSPVREAMRMLDADGLTQRAPRRGCIIAPISRDNLEHVYACRLALEPLAASATADHAGPEELQALRDAWGAMCRARDADDPAAAFLANMQLTNLLHAQCGNPALARLLAVLDKQGLRYRFIAYRGRPDFIANAVDENAALIGAIAARDADEASAITRRLIATALQSLRGLLPASGQMPSELA